MGAARALSIFSDLRAEPWRALCGRCNPTNTQSPASLTTTACSRALRRPSNGCRRKRGENCSSVRGSSTKSSMDSPAPLPENLDEVEYQPIDRENLFLLYATFAGDLERTAAAAGLGTTQVLRIVDEENWTEKLKGIIELRKSGKPGDIEKAINRAISFVQAHRLRLVVDRAIRYFTGLSENDFQDQLMTGAPGTKPGEAKIVKMSTRAIADLASALEKCHAAAYQALGDTASERVKAQAPSATAEAYSDLHAKIAQAMAKAGASKTPRAMLADAQLAQAAAARRPIHPNDCDDH